MNNRPQNDDHLTAHLHPTQQSLLRNYIELMRLPNVFTAMADVLMGFLFVLASGPHWLPAARQWWMLLMLIGASSSLYLGGIVLNDVFDLELDRVERPKRPLPSGRVSVTSAMWLGWKLLALGMFLAAIASVLAGHLRPVMVAVLTVAMIVLYDRWLKRTPLGPLAMGACRMLNVLLGMSVLVGPFTAEHWLVAGSLGLYVVGITWFARREAQQSGRLQLSGGAITMAAGIILLGLLPQVSERLIQPVQFAPQRWLLLIIMLGLLIVWRCLWAILEPTPVRVRMAVAQSVLSLVILDATVTWAVGGPAWAAVVCALLIPALFLGRWIEIT